MGEVAMGKVRSIMAMPHALLENVEALPRAATGALVVSRGGAERGLVLVEQNRVCWVAVPGLEQRLRELLGQHADRRTALRQHSIESLTALVADDEPTITWIPRAQPLHAEAPFAPAELLAAVGARLYADEAEAAELPGDLPVGASYAIGDDGEVVVVRELGGARLGVPALVGLGEWASAALDVTHGFTRKMIARALADHAGPIAIGWRSARRVVHAALLDHARDATRVADLLATLELRRFPVVLSVRVPWKLKDS